MRRCVHVTRKTFQPPVRGRLEWASRMGAVNKCGKLRKQSRKWSTCIYRKLTIQSTHVILDRIHEQKYTSIFPNTILLRSEVRRQSLSNDTRCCGRFLVDRSLLLVRSTSWWWKLGTHTPIIIKMSPITQLRLGFHSFPSRWIRLQQW